MAAETSGDSVKSKEAPSAKKETYFISGDSIMVSDGS